MFLCAPFFIFWIEFELSWPRVRNNATSYNAAWFLHRSTGFAVGTAFAAFLNASDFVVNVMKESASFASAAQVGKERERDGRNGRRSGWRRPAEIAYGKDDLEVTAFTGDFFECHGESMLK